MAGSGVGFRHSESRSGRERMSRGTRGNWGHQDSIGKPDPASIAGDEGGEIDADIFTVGAGETILAEVGEPKVAGGRIDESYVQQAQLNEVERRQGIELVSPVAGTDQHVSLHERAGKVQAKRLESHLSRYPLRSRTDRNASRLFVSTNPGLGAFVPKIAEWVIPSAVL